PSTTATTRGEQEPAPVLGRRDRAGAVQTGGACRLVHLRCTHVPLAPGLRGEHPHVPLVLQGGQRVHQQVGQVVRVAVVLTPPHQCHVGDVVVLLVHELGARGFLQLAAQPGVDIVVVAELLDHLPSLHSKTDACAVARGVRGRCHVCPLCRPPHPVGGVLIPTPYRRRCTLTQHLHRTAEF